MRYFEGMRWFIPWLFTQVILRAWDAWDHMRGKGRYGL